MANGCEEHDNSIMAPIAKAFKDLRVEMHIKMEKIVMDTGIAQSTISAFTRLDSSMRVVTLVRLLNYMKLELLDISLRITNYTREEVYEKVNKEFQRREDEAKNKDLIHPERVRE